MFSSWFSRSLDLSFLGPLWWMVINQPRKTYNRRKVRDTVSTQNIWDMWSTETSKLADKNRDIAWCKGHRNPHMSFALWRTKNIIWMIEFICLSYWVMFGMSALYAAGIRRSTSERCYSMLSSVCKMVINSCVSHVRGIHLCLMLGWVLSVSLPKSLLRPERLTD